MKTFLYTAKEDDSLAKIAAKFHTSESAIKLRNGLTGEPFEGMKLIIDEQKAFGYTVRPFDTLESIAVKFRVSYEKLKTLNGVGVVFVGQRILVPENDG